MSACIAILATNGMKLNEKQLKVSFGMTKYCHNFIFNKVCKIEDCNYFHEMVSEDNVTFMSDREYN